MGQGFDDLVALLRCGRLAGGLPSAVVFAYRTLDDLTGSFDDLVAPVVAREIGDPRERAQVCEALRAMSVKIGYAVLSYARMAGCGRPVDLAVLAGALTRLYDDLIDGDADRELDDRLSDLFGARPYTPGGDLERLLAELCYQIAHRLHPLPDETVFSSLNALHEYQCLSRRQREPAIPRDVLEKVTRGKGAMANLTLCGLVKPQMDPGERELVMALGEAFQSLDDYMDVEHDLRDGVTTLATLGLTTLPGVARRMRVLYPRLVSRHGRAAARPYGGMIYFLLLKSVVGRRAPIVGRLVRRVARRSTVLTMLTRGSGALPPAGPVSEGKEPR